MILSRRRAHFYSSITLICLLPLSFLAAMLLFPKYQATEGAAALFEQAGFATTHSDATNTEDQGTAIGTTELTAKGAKLQAQTFMIEDDRKATIVLELEPVWAIRRPDLLVYWAARDAKVDSAKTEGSEPAEQSDPEAKPVEIGENFILLGKLSGASRRVFSLPSEMYGKEGKLILYSQVQQFRVAEFPFPTSLTALDR